MYYTYLHTRNDTGKVFYIGKGIAQRAYATERNEHWRSIVAKHGFTAEILSYWSTEQEAFEHEKLLIASFKDMGYVLANKTPGGEGIPKGYQFSEEWYKKRRLINLGKTHKEETKKKIQAAHKARGPHGYITSGFSGHTHSEEMKAKMSARLKGTKQSAEHISKRIASLLSNPNHVHGMFGKTQPRAICPHCGKEGGKNVIIRWHNDNCKHKSS